MTDRAAVERLYLDYVAAVDDDLEAWPGLFTEDCSYRITSRDNVQRGLPLAIVRCDSRAMLDDRVHAIRNTAFYVSRRVRHLLGLLDIRENEEGLRVSTTYAVYESLPRQASVLLSVGVYDDVIVTGDDARLRFRQKHCIYDGDLVVDSIVYPL